MMVGCCCFGAILKLFQIFVALANLVALTARGKLCKSDDATSCVDNYNVRNFICLKHWVNWPCHEALGLLYPICSTIFSLVAVALNCATAAKRAKRLDAALALSNAMMWITVAFVYNYYSRHWWHGQIALKTMEIPLNWYVAGVCSILLVVLYLMETIIVVIPSNFYYEICCPRRSTFLDTSEEASAVEKDEETNLMQVTLTVPKLNIPKRSNSNLI